MTKALTKEWAAQVMAEHKELRLKVQDMRSFLDEPRPDIGQTGAHTWAVGLARRLLDLHDELVRHFRFEETCGLVEELVINYPRAARQLEEILADHAVILSQLREILTGALIYSEGHASSDAGLRRKVGKLLDYMGRHEREETALIQRVEYREFGVGD